MKETIARVLVFSFTVAAITWTTWALKAQQKTTEKKYAVSFPLSEWIIITNRMEVIKQQLHKTDLPARDVTFMCDSILTSLQLVIGKQVQEQLNAEKPKPEVKKDSTKPKKN